MIIRLVKKMLSVLNKWLFVSRNVKSDGSDFLLSRISVADGNALSLSDTLVKKSRIIVSGKNNTLSFNGGELYHSTIRVIGSGNCISIGSNVRLFNLTLIVKSNQGGINIGAGTSFGGGQIVSKGPGNRVTIGENCMFSDGIEIWNSDTHNILKEGKIVNPPAPVNIGNRVWIGKDSAILKGSDIGDDVVVGMRSLVTGKIDNNVVCAGIPARVLSTGIIWEC